MKKQTKNTIMVLFIVFILGFSTIAFVFLSRIPETDQNTPIEKPTKVVYEYQLNESFRQAYMQMGYTLLEFHRYQGCCPKLEMYMEALPDEVDGLIVEKITNETTKQTGPWIKIESIVGEEKTNATDIQSIFKTMCKVLSKPPLDCGFNILSQDNTNIVNQTNNTD